MPKKSYCRGYFMRNEDMEQIKKKYSAKMQPKKSIRAYCREICCAGDRKSLELCSFKDCFLWEHRKRHKKEDLKENDTILCVEDSKETIVGGK